MGKYDKYIISGRQPGNPPTASPMVAWVDNDIFKGSHQYHCHWVMETPPNNPQASWKDMGHGPHEHKAVEAVLHIGTNPKDPLDLGGEVWFTLGPEAEKHVITQSCLVYLPAGFIHSPWVIARVDRPFVIVTVQQETEHTEKPHPEIISEEDNRHMMYISQGYESKERKITLPEKMQKNW